ncbi:MAG: radical SAM (seleno)protein TrsS [Thermodesulfobacteriota bacterium]
MDVTASVCPICLGRIPARVEEIGARAWLVKNCPRHGDFRSLIWNGPPNYGFWRRPKNPTTPPVVHGSVRNGCPLDCGLCPDHRQRTCTIVLEVTGRCDLGCPYCYADAGKRPAPDPAVSQIETMLRLGRDAAGDCHLQLSGGEPALRDDLPDIVRLARANRFTFIQINTNGLRLARDLVFVRDIKAAGLESVFLQFDGTTNQIYRKMRGRDLLKEKRLAIENCGRCGLGVVLVPTIVPGVNTDDLGNIIQTALDLSPVVRGVHFQPISWFGRFPGRIPTDADRFTLPDLMRAIEEQTEGAFKAGHFRPPGCENALCSFNANYLVLEGGGVRPLSPPQGSCCGAAPEDANEGAWRTISRVARQWSAPKSRPPREPSPLPMLSPINLDAFLDRARSHTLSVSAMAFQDAWNMDLERLRDCCIHVITPAGALIPFCAYNLTAADGRRLYWS